MIGYRVGSICEVVCVRQSKIFEHMLGEIVTITEEVKRHPDGLDGYVYEVNDGLITGICEGKTYRYTPPYDSLRLITPPPEGSGLELILGMFQKEEAFA